MTEMIIDMGDGIIMRPATRTDLRIVDANLRPMDRKECEMAHDFDAVPEDYLEGVWVILHNGIHVGYGGFLCATGDTVLSRRRCFFFLSTKHVNDMKLLFVKKTPAVFRRMANMMPSYVDTIVVAPIKEYVGSIRWLERVLGFRQENEVEMNGQTFVIMTKKKGR